ncbi:MAG: MarR family transcriptional regulator [Methanotrichaceae archaeon]
MDELIGFVLGSKQREKVMNILEARGSMTSDKVAKVGHLTKPAVKRTLKNMADKGLISEIKNAWSLTDLGVEVLKELKKRA